MTKTLALALMFAVATPAFAEALPAPAGAVVATRGKMLVAANGSRLASVYSVKADGSPQIILDGKLKTVPASTLALVDGKLTTNLTKQQVNALR